MQNTESLSLKGILNLFSLKQCFKRFIISLFIRRKCIRGSCRKMHSAGGEMSLETGRQASDMLEFFKGHPAVGIELYHSHGTFLSEPVPLHFEKLIVFFSV